MESLPDLELNKLLVFWILWLVWKSRNEFIFNKRNVHPIEDVKRAMDSNIEWYRNVATLIIALVLIMRLLGLDGF